MKIRMSVEANVIIVSQRSAKMCAPNSAVCELVVKLFTEKFKKHPDIVTAAPGRSGQGRTCMS